MNHIVKIRITTLRTNARDTSIPCKVSNTAKEPSVTPIPPGLNEATPIKTEVGDIAIDFRENSKTYLKCASIILSEKNKRQLFVPKGFLHGFLHFQ